MVAFVIVENRTRQRDLLDDLHNNKVSGRRQYAGLGMRQCAF